MSNPHIYFSQSFNTSLQWFPESCLADELYRELMTDTSGSQWEMYLPGFIHISKMDRSLTVVLFSLFCRIRKLKSISLPLPLFKEFTCCKATKL